MSASICQWFATCTNATKHGVKHPILGLVPCCERCATKLGLDRQPLPGDDLCPECGELLDGRGDCLNCPTE